MGDIQTNLDTLKNKALASINACQSVSDCHAIKPTLIGKKSDLTHLLRSISHQPADQRATMGQAINQLKHVITQALLDRQADLTATALDTQVAASYCDVTQPSLPRYTRGHWHPITHMTRRVCDFFTRQGYSIKTGPEIETEFYNFEALNIPDDHPARDMHDTFYLDPSHLLRTHTSPVQIRTMLTTTPPLQIIVPGRVYRCDSDRSHSIMFHQIEGLVVGDNLSFSVLKTVLSALLRDLFGETRPIRFRPSYFPFTEPSAEVDVQWETEAGTEWLEILGCGLVHQHVFESVNLPADTTGFAFGLGIERLAMLYYNIPSIKLLHENDQRFLDQF